MVGILLTSLGWETYSINAHSDGEPGYMKEKIENCYSPNSKSEQFKNGITCRVLTFSRMSVISRPREKTSTTSKPLRLSHDYKVCREALSC